MTTLRIQQINESDNLIGFEEITTGVKAELMKSRFLAALQNLYYWRKDINSSNFTSCVYRLLCKADDMNRLKLFVGFPEETIAYLLWYTNKNSTEEEFFNKWLTGKEN